MAIDLNDLADVTPQPITTSSETITTEVAAGKTLVLRERSTPLPPDPADWPPEVIAAGRVPTNKKWTAQWILCITETDE